MTTEILGTKPDWAQDAELVALPVGQHDPGHVGGLSDRRLTDAAGTRLAGESSCWSGFRASPHLR
ncbi:hypothetical protein AB0L00_31755 [Actinoallomurus sp. NPDC052308]|uniref:hypothetical protein n=1 Tax=Actinoallomurus sp. NPDC052308 TaxID=3155530 RepID=UPI00342B1BAF